MNFFRLENTPKNQSSNSTTQNEKKENNVIVETVQQKNNNSINTLTIGQQPLNKQLYFKDKHHFFIGNFTTDLSQVQIIKNLRNMIKSRYNIKDDSYFNFMICYKFIYLGYMTDADAFNYMNKIMSKLLITIVNNVKKLTCHYTRFKVRYAKNKTLIKVSLEFDDDNDIISKVIIPYINKNGVSTVYGKNIPAIKPSLELIYAKPRPGFSNVTRPIDLKVPQEPFVIDSLSLIRGTVINQRSGTPSKNDNLSFDEVKKYRYNLM
jgi:hypothetical protein